jgi:4-oxalocrotonate tautomerase
MDRGAGSGRPEVPGAPQSEETPMPYVNVKLVEGVFDEEQKQEMLSRITETMVDIEGEALRPYTLVTIEELRSGDWSVGGHVITTQAARSLRAAS